MRVFISSTVHDLRNLRSSLREEFIRFGFDPVLSEFGDIEIELDEHTYDACIKAAVECDVVVGVLGRRGGGEIKKGNHVGKTITQAEIEAAADAGKPVYVFARKAIYDAAKVYRAYMGSKSSPQPFVESENLVEDERILKFVREWTSREKGNWISTYETPSEIARKVMRQLEMTEKRAGVLNLRELDSTLGHLSFRLEALSTNLDFLAGDKELESIATGERSGVFNIFNQHVHARLNQCTAELIEIANGTLKYRGDICAQMTANCFANASKCVQATSFPSTEFWNNKYGGSYLNYNLEALQRGVKITRYFILPEDERSSKISKRASFRTTIQKHLDIKLTAARSKGAAAYTIKIVHPKAVWVNWHGDTTQQIPDVSYFDHCVESDWITQTGREGPDASRISLVGPRRGELDALFESLEAGVTSTEIREMDDLTRAFKARS